MTQKLRHRPLFAQSLPKAVSSPKIKWVVLPIIWLALKRTAMVLGFFVLFQVLLLILVLPAALQNVAPVFPDQSVLFLKLDDTIEEVKSDSGFAGSFGDSLPTVHEIVDTLDHAAEDKHVKGLLVRLDAGGFGLSHADEIRAALARFKAAGKFAYIYSPSYAEAGGLGAYYLASAFDQIWMQPMGVVSVAGINAEIPFARDTLDKIGVEPQFFQRKEYKTAYESLTNSKISPANREAMSQLIADIRARIMDVIPAEREIDKEAFLALVDRGLLTAEEAQAAKLITHTDYADVLVDAIKDKVAGNTKIANDDIFVPFGTYAQHVLPDASSAAPLGEHRPKVALVYAVGTIMPTAGHGGGAVAAADEIAPAILQAIDEKVQAIVLRIDSPGGSPTASESILRAVEKAQNAGIPVIVSMGPVAASGGYWIAAYADKIYVLPTTITGSIGVLGGKFSLAGLWDKVGVNWDRIKWGENAGLWSFNRSFSEGEAERFNAMLDQIYDGFLQRVATGRGMDVEDVDKVAGGRVWSGRRAIQMGLADEVGGLTDALDYTAFILEKESRKDLVIEVLPKPKSALEKLVAFLDGQAVLAAGVRDNAALLEWLEPAAKAMMQARSPQDFTVHDSLADDLSALR
ncbi:MAG: signal peptide peptidase SppA [Bdellovibrionales bacterium]